MLIRLLKKLPEMNRNFSCGKDAYVYFLKNIALIPQTPEELLQQGRLAFNRSVSFETIEKVRNKDLPEDKIFASIEEQITQATEDEQAIRRFLEDKNIMSVPDWLKHYLYCQTPPEVQALSHMGVATDLEPNPDLIDKKVAHGTHSLAKGPAMSREQAMQSIESGIDVVEAEIKKGMDILGIGDMGIGNTTPSSAIVVAITGAPVAKVTGRGTGIDDATLAHKIQTIEQSPVQSLESVVFVL